MWKMDERGTICLEYSTEVSMHIVAANVQVPLYIKYTDIL